MLVEERLYGAHRRLRLPLTLMSKVRVVPRAVHHSHEPRRQGAICSLKILCVPHPPPRPKKKSPASKSGRRERQSGVGNGLGQDDSDVSFNPPNPLCLWLHFATKRGEQTCARDGTMDTSGHEKRR